MLTVTLTEARPNTAVPFYTWSYEFITYIQKFNDIRTGNKGQYTVSSDQLSRTGIETFASQADLDTYKTDITVTSNIDSFNSYNQTNNITVTRTYS